VDTEFITNYGCVAPFLTNMENVSSCQIGKYDAIQLNDFSNAYYAYGSIV
jgi:hypothetical protein